MLYFLIYYFVKLKYCEIIYCFRINQQKLSKYNIDRSKVEDLKQIDSMFKW